MLASRLLAFVIVTTATVRAQFDKSTCYQENGKGCYLWPEGCDPATNCTKAVSWKAVDGYLNMELTGISPGGTSNYIAVGFSSDNRMGEEPVTDCTFGPQGTTVHLSYNTGKSNTRVTDYAAQANDLILMNGNTNNGRLYCAFRQRITPSQSSNDNRVQSLDRPVYLLIAVGSASASGLNPHEMNPVSNLFPRVSSRATNLAQTESYSSSGSASSGGSGISPETKFKLIKAHGTMMILAWFIFVVTAMMFARYYRGHWPNTKPMGLLIWFHFHRTFNVIAVVLMIAAFVCIFVAEEGKWEGPKVGGGAANSEWGSVHSMTGILAVCLAWLQPIMALFRCAPSKPLRPLFNWPHRFVGIAAWLLAATTITIAVYHFPGMWSSTVAAKGLVIAYLVLVGVMIVLQEVLTIVDMVKRRQMSRVDVLEMQAAAKGPGSPTSPAAPSFTTSSKTKTIRLLLMGLFMVIGWGLAIAMVVLIAVN